MEAVDLSDNLAWICNDVRAGAARVALRPFILEKGLEKKNGSSVLECEACLHPGATRVRRFNHHSGKRESRHNPISKWKGSSCRRRVRPELRNHCTDRSDFLLKFSVGCGIDAPQAGPDYSDCSTRGRQRSKMRGRVDALRETTYGHDASFSKGPRKP